jgi:L-threonylcarbamoyladenylate synthase
LAKVIGIEAASISSASALIGSGGVVAFPTDTVYGLACDPWSEAATARLFEVKSREDKPVPVLCSTAALAESVVVLNQTAMDLARRFWPGALTIVAPLRRTVPARIDQRSGWLGVRVPAHEVAIELARLSGGFITGTSANISGQPSCTTAAEVERSLGDHIDAIIDGGPTLGGASTVVKVVGESVEVLRRGLIGVESGITRDSSK